MVSSPASSPRELDAAGRAVQDVECVIEPPAQRARPGATLKAPCPSPGLQRRSPIEPRLRRASANPPGSPRPDGRGLLRDGIRSTQALAVATLAFDEPVAGIPGVLSPAREEASSGHRRDGTAHDQPGCSGSNGQDEPSPLRATVHHARPSFAATTSISSASHAVESPTARWLGLLIGDAILDNDGAWPDLGPEHGWSDVFGEGTASVAPTSDTALLISRAEEEQGIDASNQYHRENHHLERFRSCNRSLEERSPHLGSDQLVEKRAWYSLEPIRLSERERRLFHHFVRHVSTWVS